MTELGEHLVCRLDRLRIEFVGALRLDHRHQFLDDVDVRGLDEALLDRAEAVGARGSDVGRAGRRGLGVEIAAARIQAGRIDEVGDLYLADVGRRRLRWKRYFGVAASFLLI